MVSFLKIEGLNYKKEKCSISNSQECSQDVLDKRRNKMEGPMSKKTNESPKRVNHKGNIKFPNLFPIVKSISYKEKGGPLERRFSQDEPSLIAITHLKIDTACTCSNVTNTLYL
jgi:hypothetical protein